MAHCQNGVKYYSGSLRCPIYVCNSDTFLAIGFTLAKLYRKQA